MPVFCWHEWNIEPISTHGVVPEEAQEIVRRARPPFPRDQGDEKFLVVAHAIRELLKHEGEEARLESAMKPGGK